MTATIEIRATRAQIVLGVRARAKRDVVPDAVATTRGDQGSRTRSDPRDVMTATIEIRATRAQVTFVVLARAARNEAPDPAFDRA